MLLLLLIWCFSIGVSLPAMYEVEHRYKTQTHSWVCAFAISKISYIYNLILTFIIIIPIIISLITIYILAAKALAIHGLDCNNFAVKRRNVMNKKVVKLFTVIVCTFSVLTIPYYLYTFAFSTCLYYGIIKSLLEMKTCGMILSIMVLVITSNCCVNPLIYCKMHKDISRCAVNIERRILNNFCCLCRKIST